jgi:putative hydrolase of HD superfamily
MPSGRLPQQLAFLVEIDRLKHVRRRTPLADGSRLENSAEHSWHLAMCAMILREHADGPIDLLRVLQMLAVHDIVEIDAGDTFAYDVGANAGKSDREAMAAERLFGMLPDDQAVECRRLWDEFEARTTNEARLANAVDRLQPLLLNATAGGGSWVDPQVTRAKVEARMTPVADAMPGLGAFVADTIAAFAKAGILPG